MVELRRSSVCSNRFYGVDCLTVPATSPDWRNCSASSVYRDALDQQLFNYCQCLYIYKLMVPNTAARLPRPAHGEPASRKRPETARYYRETAILRRSGSLNGDSGPPDCA